MSPRITVVIVARNEEQYIKKCVESILAQEGAPSHEMLLVDAGSTDQTKEIMEHFSHEYTHVSMKSIEHRGIGYARKTAFQDISTGLICSVDADCRVPQDWLARMYTGYMRLQGRDKRVAVVGGSHIPFEDASFFQRVLGILKKSPLSSGSHAYRAIASTDREVEHMPTANSLYDMDKIEGIQWNEGYTVACEDVDMSYHIQKSGWKIVQLADSYVEHKMQRDMLSWCTSMLRYGYGRAQFVMDNALVTQKYILYLLPLLTILLSSILFFIAPILLGVALLSYLILIICESTRLSLTGGFPLAIPLLIILFPVTHIFYGLGEGFFFMRRLFLF